MTRAAAIERAPDHKFRWQLALPESDLPMPVITTLWAMSFFGDADGTNVRPTQGSIAELVRKDVRTIRRHLEQAEASGWIVRTGWHAWTASRRTRVYSLVIPGTSVRTPERPNPAVATDTQMSEPDDGDGHLDVRTDGVEVGSDIRQGRSGHPAESVRTFEGSVRTPGCPVTSPYTSPPQPDQSTSPPDSLDEDTTDVWALATRLAAAGKTPTTPTADPIVEFAPAVDPWVMAEHAGEVTPKPVSGGVEIVEFIAAVFGDGGDVEDAEEGFAGHRRHAGRWDRGAESDEGDRFWDESRGLYLDAAGQVERQQFQRAPRG